MNTLIRLLSIAAVTFALVGCGAHPGDALVGRTFIATSATVGGAPRPIVPGTSIRVTFGDDGAIGVSAGCNSMGGTYRVVDGILRFDGGAMTEMACDEERMAQDEWVFAFFGSDPAVALAGNDLVLTSGATVMRLTDKEVVEPDLPLVGPLWTVDSLVSGDAVSSVPGGVVATVRFTDDGRVEIANGCNQGGGRYTLDGTTIQFSDLIMTEMACDGPAGAMESAVMAVLGADSVSFAVDASTLTLGAGAAGLILRGS